MGPASGHAHLDDRCGTTATGLPRAGKDCRLLEIVALCSFGVSVVAHGRSAGIDRARQHCHDGGGESLDVTWFELVASASRIDLAGEEDLVGIDVSDARHG